MRPSNIPLLPYAVTTKFELLGLTQVLGKFDQLERQLTRDAATAVQETTLEIAYGAKRDAPVDMGSLQQSINTEYNARDLEGTVFVNAAHGPYVEFGTGGLVEVPEGFAEMAAEFIGSGERYVNLPARPFLIPNARKGAIDLQLKLLRLIR